MKKSAIIIASITLGSLALSSCSGMKNFNSSPASSMGIVGKSYAATVIEARTIEIEASSTTTGLSTAGGAIAGGAAGSMLGSGSGNNLAIAGGAILGGLLARGVASSAGTTPAQELTLKVDGSSATYTIKQPIYEQFGLIQPGTTGRLVESGNSSYFQPN